MLGDLPNKPKTDETDANCITLGAAASIRIRQGRIKGEGGRGGEEEEWCGAEGRDREGRAACFSDLPRDPEEF